LVSLLNVPCNTFLKAGLLVPISLNHQVMVGCNKGVSLAWENRRPASSRHAFSSKYLDENSCLSPSAVGPMTTCNGPLLGFVRYAKRTNRAVFLAFSVCRCCFHRIFVDVPFACAWALMRLAIHVFLAVWICFQEVEAFIC